MRILLIVTASALAFASANNAAMAQSPNPNPMVESNPNPAIGSDENAVELQHRNSMSRMKMRQRVTAAVSTLESAIRELQASTEGFGGRKGLALASSRQAVSDLKRVLEYHEPPPPLSSEPNPARRGR
jgi:hypothetical protein